MFHLWILVAFLALNAVPWTPVVFVGWGLALFYVVISLLTRTDEIGVPKELAVICICPALLLLLGGFGIYRNGLNDFLKDCWYFSNPLIYIAFGYFMMERLRASARLITTFTIAGVAASVYAVVNCYFHASELASATSVNSYRHITGTGS